MKCMQISKDWLVLIPLIALHRVHRACLLLVVLSSTLHRQADDIDVGNRNRYVIIYVTNQFVIYVCMCVYMYTTNQVVENPITLSPCTPKHTILAD